MNALADFAIAMVIWLPVSWLFAKASTGFAYLRGRRKPLPGHEVEHFFNCAGVALVVITALAVIFGMMGFWGPEE